MASKPPAGDPVQDAPQVAEPQHAAAGTARHRPHPAHRPAADGRPAHRAHPAARQPEGRLRLPRLRLARAGPPAHRGVLRERRQGRRRGGHPAPGHPGLLRRAPRRRPRRPQRLLARPAGPPHPPHVPRRRAPTTTSRSTWERAFDIVAEELRRARLPRRGRLLHLGPHQQRGRVPLPALRPRVRHQQPARLLQHVPRVVRLGADRDHRRRQGQRPARGPPPGRPDHRRRAEPGHQPPAHALRPGEGQGGRREDHHRQPAARGGPGTLQEPADPAGPARRRRAHRPVPADPPRRRPGPLPRSSTS